MKQGDEVKTPKGLGIFFDIDKENSDIALIILQKPSEKAIWYPLIELGQPIWECFKCDKINIKEISINKTFEQRQYEAEMAARKAAAQKEAAIRAFMEAKRKAHEEQKKKTRGEKNESNAQQNSSQN